MTPLIVTALVPLIVNPRATSLSARKTFPPMIVPPVLLTVSVRPAAPELVKLPFNAKAKPPLIVPLPPQIMLLASVRALVPA